MDSNLEKAFITLFQKTKSRCEQPLQKLTFSVLKTGLWTQLPMQTYIQRKTSSRICGLQKKRKSLTLKTWTLKIMNSKFQISLNQLTNKPSSWSENKISITRINISTLRAANTAKTGKNQSGKTTLVPSSKSPQLSNSSKNNSISLRKGTTALRRRHQELTRISPLINIQQNQGRQVQNQTSK